MSILQLNGFIINTIPSRRSHPIPIGMFSVQRQPTDPYYYSSVTLQNVVVGSRYRLSTYPDVGDVVATGIANTSTVVLSNIPALSSPAMFVLVVRNSSVEPTYESFETIIIMPTAGATLYVDQKLD